MELAPDDDAPDIGALRSLAWRLFEANAFSDAAVAFTRVLATGADDPEAAEALLQLLIDAHDWQAVATFTAEYLQHRGAELTANDRVAWTGYHFDALVRTEPSTTVRAEAALAHLEAVAAAGGTSWASVVDSTRRKEIEEACRDRETSLALVEQDSYAPV